MNEEGQGQQASLVEDEEDEGQRKGQRKNGDDGDPFLTLIDSWW